MSKPTTSAPVVRTKGFDQRFPRADPAVAERSSGAWPARSAMAHFSMTRILQKVLALARQPLLSSMLADGTLPSGSTLRTILAKGVFIAPAGHAFNCDERRTLGIARFAPIEVTSCRLKRVP
jgi:hypothetical protein